MQHSIKTTVEIEAELLYLAKKKALEEKKTLKTIISDGLKKELGLQKRKARLDNKAEKIGGFALGGIRGGLRRVDIYEDY